MKGTCENERKLIKEEKWRGRETEEAPKLFQCLLHLAEAVNSVRFFHTPPCILSLDPKFFLLNHTPLITIKVPHFLLRNPSSLMSGIWSMSCTEILLRHMQIPAVLGSLWKVDLIRVFTHACTHFQLAVYCAVSVILSFQTNVLQT